MTDLSRRTFLKSVGAAAVLLSPVGRYLAGLDPEPRTFVPVPPDTLMDGNDWEAVGLGTGETIYTPPTRLEAVTWMRDGDVLVMDAADTTWPAFTAPEPLTHLWLGEYPMMRLDQGPLWTTGGDITVQWPASGVMKVTLP